VRIVDQQIVHTNPYPSYASEVYSGTGLTKVAEEDAEVLMCTFRAGSAKVSPDGRVVTFASRDRGRSWEQWESPFDRRSSADWQPPAGPHQLAGPHIGSSSTATVVLAVARMEVPPPGSARWNAEAGGIADADFAVAARHGGTWSLPTVLDGRRHRREWSIPCGSPVELEPGCWLLPGERHAMPDDAEWLRRYHAFAYYSDDDARTWTEHAPMLNDPDQQFVYYDQHVAVVGTGRLLSIAWVHDAIDDQTVTARAGWSDDGGLSWSHPHDTGIVGGPVVPLTLSDGRVFAVYPRRLGDVGIRACVSADEGATWQLDGEFVIWDESRREVVGRDVREDGAIARAEPLWGAMWGWTFGLPGAAVLDDGTVGLVFYAADRRGASTVHFVRLEV
jgi:hypothetical protein